MRLSYFREYDYGVMEVIVEFPDDGATGTVEDVIIHPIGYEPPESMEIIYKKKIIGGKNDILEHCNET